MQYHVGSLKDIPFSLPHGYTEHARGYERASLMDRGRGRPGDFAWAGVGACHAFAQTGDEPFRWIETQAPQFPDRNGTRNYAEWEKYQKGF